jgi:hypothetical protein
MKDVDRENWQRLGNMQETLSFDLCGRVVERAELSGYHARVMVNPNGSIYQFENFDRGVIGFGCLDKDKRFIFNMTLPCTTTRTLLDMLQRQSFRDTDAPDRELVRLRMGIINLRHPQDARPNLVGSVCGFDLIRLDLRG